MKAEDSGEVWNEGNVIWMLMRRHWQDERSLSVAVSLSHFQCVKSVLLTHSCTLFISQNWNKQDSQSPVVTQPLWNIFQCINNIAQHVAPIPLHFLRPFSPCNWTSSRFEDASVSHLGWSQIQGVHEVLTTHTHYQGIQ